MKKVTMRATLQNNGEVSKVNAVGVGLLALMVTENNDTEVRMLGQTVNPLELLATALQYFGKVFPTQTDTVKSSLLVGLENFARSVGEMQAAAEEMLKDYEKALDEEFGNVLEE